MKDLVFTTVIGMAVIFVAGAFLGKTPNPTATKTSGAILAVFGGYGLGTFIEYLAGIL